MIDQTPFQQQFIDDNNPSYHKSLCVIIHLFYQDLWEWFLPYLANINVDFDIYVTLIKDGENYDVESRILAIYPNATITYLDNKGMDIAPLIYVLNHLKDSGRQYDCLLKLHSKKSLAHSYELGYRWRSELVNALLKDTTTFDINFKMCAFHPTNKMVGAGNWILKQQMLGYEKEYISNVPLNFDEYEFIGGTIFMVNYHVMMDWFIKNDIYNKFFDLFQNGYIADGSIAHHIERVFGCLMKVNGYIIVKN